MQRLLLIAATASCIACQTYTAASLTSVAPGNDIKVGLTAVGDSVLTSVLGPQAGTVDGKVVSADSTGVRLAVHQIERTDGSDQLLYGKEIRIPADAVATIAVKRVDVMRSVVLAGGIVVGAALVARVGNGSQTQGGSSVSTANPR